MSYSFSQICTLPPIPELLDPNFLWVLLPSEDRQHSLDQLTSKPSEYLAASVNSDATGFRSSCYDAFRGLDARLPKSFHRLDTLLQASWLESPETTLKIIWHIRSIRDGKGQKELFYRYALFIKFAQKALIWSNTERLVGCMTTILVPRYQTFLWSLLLFVWLLGINLWHMDIGKTFSTSLC